MFGTSKRAVGLVRGLTSLDVAKGAGAVRRQSVESVGRARADMDGSGGGDWRSEEVAGQMPATFMGGDKAGSCA